MASQTAAKARHTKTTAAPDVAEPLDGETTAAQEATLEQLAEAVKGKGLHAKIAWVQHHVGHVDKTGQMSHGNIKYPFMQEHGLINVLRPLLRIAGLSAVCGMVTPDAWQRDGNTSIVVIGLTVTDGETADSITRYYVNEGIDNQDKGFGKAYTGATKYALQKFFLVPTEAIDDNDQLTVERVGGQTVGAQVRDITSAKPKAEDLAALRATLASCVEEGHLETKTIKNKLTADFGVSSIDALASKDDLRKFGDWVVEQVDKPGGERS